MQLRKLFDRIRGKDLYKEAVRCHSPFRSRDRRHLIEEFPYLPPSEVEQAYELAGRLWEAAEAYMVDFNRNTAEFDTVVGDLALRVPGLSKAAYRWAADKVFLLTRW